MNQEAPISYDVIGGNLRDSQAKKDGEMYRGPDWFTSGAMMETFILEFTDN